MRWAWRCWNDLQADRPHLTVGMGSPMGAMLIRSVPGRIPWTAVHAWCERDGRGGDDMALLLRLLGEMDDEYLTWWAQQNGGKR